MPILTMHRLVQMDRDTLYAQKRWLVLGCLLNFDRQYALCCPKHLERRRDKVLMDSPPLFWGDPNNLGMSRLDWWKVEIFDETKYESFVSASRQCRPAGTMSSETAKKRKPSACWLELYTGPTFGGMYADLLSERQPHWY